MIARIELGDRRVDFAEPYQILVALGTDPNQETDSLMNKFAGTLVSFPQKRDFQRRSVD